MTPWAKGAFAGLAVGLLIAFWAGNTSVDAFIRVTGDGQPLLDTRVDESVVGRLVNIPVASLGELAVSKRVWLVVTTYVFTLRVRPELAPGPERPLTRLLVNVRLPGRVVTTNATRVTGGTAVWEGMPADALQLRTVAVEWARVAILVVVLVVGLGLRRS
ncbi:MAG: hypothetical protein AUH31_01035 [Armatimonadetes bacterium 13_1_40CM_64_14]|nr:MAG: hypothetical protein AUH31_01035 [Armatimonadetes bacterium 13_1_40CM_64_14]